jgi:hypothetical protein
MNVYSSRSHTIFRMVSDAGSDNHLRKFFLYPEISGHLSGITSMPSGPNKRVKASATDYVPYGFHGRLLRVETLAKMEVRPTQVLMPCECHAWYNNFEPRSSVIIFQLSS